MFRILEKREDFLNATFNTMHPFTHHALKNNIDLLAEGPCQFCDAAVTGGVFECMEIYANSVLAFEYDIPQASQTRFVIVDAYALQHAELHGRWNNHFHLTRLCLILDKKMPWNYELSPLLSDYIDEYKKSHPDEIIPVPPKLQRGLMTAKDVSLFKNPQDYEELAMQWARDVYAAYGASHEVVSGIAEGFMEEVSFKGV